MTNITVFIQTQGQDGVHEAELPKSALFGDLLDALKAKGIEIDEKTQVFIDEHEEPLPSDRKLPIKHLKRGCRVLVSRCRRINTVVHFLDKATERSFPPGARVKTVKEWAVREFRLTPQDAGEHVLQLCNSTKQPPTDTLLAELTRGDDCSLCFDLVPEKRVEGSHE